MKFNTNNLKFIIFFLNLKMYLLTEWILPFGIRFIEVC
jgi:hypothetical protein